MAAPQMMKADSITYVSNVNQTTSYSFDGTTGSATITPDVIVTFPGVDQTIDFSANSFGVFANVSDGVSLLQDLDGQPAALAAGALIDPVNGTFGTNGKLSSPVTGKGNFPVNGEAYLGFYFTEADGLHAGWADLAMAGTTDGTNASVTVNSYAYENDPNTPILAGQTVAAATPEPTSLSLIAMGAAGIAELRRRRRKYAEAA